MGKPTHVKNGGVGADSGTAPDSEGVDKSTVNGKGAEEKKKKNEKTAQVF